MRDRAKERRLMLGAGFSIAAVVGIGIALWWPEQPSVRPELRLVPLDDVRSWLGQAHAGARIPLTRPTADPDANDGWGPERHSTAGVGELVTLGPLEGKDFSDALLLVESILRTKTLQVETLRRDLRSDDTAGALREAAAVKLMEEAVVGLGALRNGDYIVTETEQLPTTVEGASLLMFGARRQGKGCIVTVVMAYAKYPQLQAATRFYEAAKQFHHAAVVDKFNALSDAERASLLDRRQELMNKQGRTSQENAFLVQQFPPGAVIDAARRRLMFKRP